MKLPPTLSPFATNHPASTAYWITCSPHEWVWTQAEQEAMARAVVELDAERQRLKALMRRALPTIDSRLTDYAEEFRAACEPNK